MNKNKIDLKEYYAVRVMVVKVKRGFFGSKDKTIASGISLHLKEETAIEVLNKIRKIMKEYGIEYSV